MRKITQKYALGISITCALLLLLSSSCHKEMERPETTTGQPVVQEIEEPQNNIPKEASKKTTEQLVTQEIEATKNKIPKEEKTSECRICLEVANETQGPLEALSCCQKACVHKQCLIRWLMQEGTPKTCPRCQRSIVHLIAATN